MGTQTMKRSALFYDNSRFNGCNAPRILAVCDCATMIARTEAEFITLVKMHSYDLLIYPIEAHLSLLVQAPEAANIPSILLSQSKINDLRPYFDDMKSTNILAKRPDGHIKARDLITTVNKIFNKDIFGVQYYVNFGTKSEIYHIRDSEERSAYIDAATEFCRRMRVRTSTIQAVELFCEELLMNAIYDAPRDENGEELYGHFSRRDRVILKPQEAARMEYACDGEKLVVSVSDPFGAITWETVQSYLNKCFSAPSKVGNLAAQGGGAGLGLYFCFNAANSFIINVNPEVRSEFIGIFDLDTSPRERHSSFSSLHFFSTSPGAPKIKKNAPIWKAS